MAAVPLTNECTSVDDYVNAFEATWQRDLARATTADLQDEREYTSRRYVEVDHDGTFCGETVSKFSWLNLLGARLSWLDEELERRERLDRMGIVRLAPRRIPVTFIEDLRRRVPLHEFVTHEYPETHLKRSGSDYAGHCPFHTDQSPSLHVWPSEARWWCFAESQGGDVFDLVLVGNRAPDFRRAVEYVASYAHLPMPAPEPLERAS